MTLFLVIIVRGCWCFSLPLIRLSNNRGTEPPFLCAAVWWNYWRLVCEIVLFLFKDLWWERNLHQLSRTWTHYSLFYIIIIIILLLSGINNSFLSFIRSRIYGRKQMWNRCRVYHFIHYSGSILLFYYCIIVVEDRFFLSLCVSSVRVFIVKPERCAVS